MENKFANCLFFKTKMPREKIEGKNMDEFILLFW
jgi:hypothetical protein